MKKFFKIFQKEKDIVAIEYTVEDQKNYFNFVKSQTKQNMRQVIITSEIMLEIIEKSFLKNNICVIKSIKFAEEDSELDEEINLYIKHINNDKENLKKLFTKLECISNSSSIDIEEIEVIIKERENDEFIKMKIWVNGIIGIDTKNNRENKIKYILEVIKSKLES
ncbi:hypothetical protein A2U04_00800 [Fusobacterium necrophorum subsp. funduliforme]|uniref:hypothetical protein n=1 Tax=Fusobacterium necrophorum TaxID=859 RepID=UPI000788616F|nr:hypothetical protein [Fusobacterium necrophorum]KYM50913.1 hypothetical protein A2U04_00800 [Fusobacterium necrophorum subsp. funduliforme]